MFLDEVSFLFMAMIGYIFIRSIYVIIVTIIIIIIIYFENDVHILFVFNVSIGGCVRLLLIFFLWRMELIIFYILYILYDQYLYLYIYMSNDVYIHINGECIYLYLYIKLL